MTTDEQESHRRTSPLPVVREGQHIPVAFWAFHSQYRRAYQRYAELHLGDAGLAREVVHLVFFSLLRGWHRLMEEANPAASAWAHLKEAIDEVLLEEGRHSAMPEAAAFAKVKRAVLEGARDEFAAMDSTLGLYPAIARLPARQFDVAVLHWVLGYTTARTARTLGVTDATVRSHRLAARQRLAHDLGMQTDPDRNEE